MNEQPNIDVIDDAIRVMARVRDQGYRLNMRCFIDYVFPDESASIRSWEIADLIKEAILRGESERVLHERGITASFIGWFALSPEGRAHGLRLKPKVLGHDLLIGSIRREAGSCPDDRPEDSVEAIRRVFGMDELSVRRLCGLEVRRNELKFYGSGDDNPTPHDVIDALRALRTFGALGERLALDRQRLREHEGAVEAGN